MCVTLCIEFSNHTHTHIFSSLRLSVRCSIPLLRSHHDDDDNVAADDVCVFFFSPKDASLFHSTLEFPGARIIFKYEAGAEHIKWKGQIQ